MMTTNNKRKLCYNLLADRHCRRLACRVTHISISEDKSREKKRRSKKQLNFNAIKSEKIHLKHLFNLGNDRR